MAREWRNAFIFLGVVLVVIWFISSDNNPLDNSQITNNNQNVVSDIDAFSKSSFPHWTHMPITYKIKNDYCTNFTADRIRWAFNVLENESKGSVRFEEVIDNSLRKIKYTIEPIEPPRYNILIKGDPNKTILFDIPVFGRWTLTFDQFGLATVNCSIVPQEAVIFIETINGDVSKRFYLNFSDNPSLFVDTTQPSDNEKITSGEDTLPEEDTPLDTRSEIQSEKTDILIKCLLEAPENGRYYTAGEATPIINSDNKIVGGLIYFYNVGENRYSGGCLNYPLTEVHEILHLFGFDHTVGGIMAPIGYGCTQFKIDDQIINDLRATYSLSN